MNPLLQQFLGGLLRTGLQWLAAGLVAKGVFTPDQMEAFITGAILAILTFSWSMWVKYKGRLRFLKAMEMPSGVSEAQVKREVALDRKAG